MEEKFVDVNFLLEYIKNRRVYIGKYNDDLGIKIGMKTELDTIESFVNKITTNKEEV